MRFTKMQGLGNDYLYVYGEVPENIKELSIKLSDRHFGAGSDGMIFISPSDVADFKMRVFNADGSEAKMCGNGIRCVGKYVYDKGYTNKQEITVETLSGIKNLKFTLSDGKVKSVSVEMGVAVTEDEIEISTESEKFILLPVSMGNPHAVVFVDDAEEISVETLGPKIENQPIFPDGVNVEFVEVLSRNELRMRVWERGSGVTLACGTGACASVVAAIKKGFCNYSEPISVTLDGGVLQITVYEDNSVVMNGPAEIVYEGEVL
ncbi:MAG: diaminopimelate epimerase [Ruminococcaceae bacterium]|nr:diaminopimelate epimerase [Oscillospiraceae bacterium]